MSIQWVFILVSRGITETKKLLKKKTMLRGYYMNEYAVVVMSWKTKYERFYK